MHPMHPERLFNYGSRRLNRRSRSNSCFTCLVLNSGDLNCPVGFWPIFSTKVSLKRRLPTFYHHILDAEQLFSDRESSFIPAVVAHRIDQDYSHFSLFLWFWWMVDSAFGATNNAVSEAKAGYNMPALNVCVIHSNI